MRQSNWFPTFFLRRMSPVWSTQVSLNQCYHYLLSLNLYYLYETHYVRDPFQQFAHYSCYFLNYFSNTFIKIFHLLCSLVNQFSRTLNCGHTYVNISRIANPICRYIFYQSNHWFNFFSQLVKLLYNFSTHPRRTAEVETNISKTGRI